MTIAVLFGSFAIFLLLTIPIGISLGLATLLTIFIQDLYRFSF